MGSLRRRVQGSIAVRDGAKLRYNAALRFAKVLGVRSRVFRKVVYMERGVMVFLNALLGVCQLHHGMEKRNHFIILFFTGL